MAIINPVIKGKQPVIDTLSVTPTTSAQTITAPSGTDGYSPVNVSAVTSSIDANIVAGNIKKDVQILGVTGSYEGINPTGTKSITANGVYDVTNYASADVQVPTTAPDYYLLFSKIGGSLERTNQLVNLNGITTIGNSGLRYLYTGYNINTNIDMSNITTISANGCESAFYTTRGNFNVDLSGLTTINDTGCSAMFSASDGIRSVDLSSLTSISNGSACQKMFTSSKVTSVDLSSLETVSGGYGMYLCFQSCVNITDVNLPSLTTLSGDYSMYSCFQSCSGLTSINLSSLVTVSGVSALQNCFQSCYGATSINLSSLATVSNTNGMNGCFQYCSGVTSVDLSSLTTISGTNAMTSCFRGCTGITSINLPSLTTVSSATAMQNCFLGCTNLSKLSFYALDTNSFGTVTNQFNGMLGSVTGCTVHFPMRIQSTIGSWSSVTGGFGGTNTTVLFDIVCTLTGADTNTYTRSQKNSTPTATAWDNSGTLYYTSGLTDPTVGTTIYSDAACTTAVTTVSAIA